MIAKPWRSHIAWQGSSWHLRVDELVLPDGGIVEKGIINHPGSVAILPLQDGQVMMLRQYRLALDDTILELPAGTREGDEPWLTCAQRELREETGYRAEHWTSLGYIWPAPGITNELMAVFLATDLSPDPLPADPDEEIEVTPYPLSDLVMRALDGRLRDAKSIIAILRAADYFKRQS